MAVTTATDEDGDVVGPRPLPKIDPKVNYGGALLAGEGDAMARFVQGMCVLLCVHCRPCCVCLVGEVRVCVVCFLCPFCNYDGTLLVGEGDSVASCMLYVFVLCCVCTVCAW